MQSFKQFLNENEHLSPKQAALLVIKNCQQFLKETGFNITSSGSAQNGFFRGINQTVEFAHRYSRSDRKPKDSSESLHNLLDEHFKKHFGFPYRSGGTFASASYNLTISYGHPCLIFPLDGYSYVFSSEIRDAYPFFGGHAAWPWGLYKETDEFRKIMSDLGFSKEDADKIESRKEFYALVSDWLEQEKPYTDKNLKDVFNHNFDKPPEVMFNCLAKGYYSVATQHNKNDFYYEFLEELAKLL